MGLLIPAWGPYVSTYDPHETSKSGCGAAGRGVELHEEAFLPPAVLDLVWTGEPVLVDRLGEDLAQHVCVFTYIHVPEPTNTHYFVGSV